MGYAIEMTFDAETEKRHRALWRALAEAGISSSMVDLGGRPHVSLAVLEHADAAAVSALTEAWAAGTPPFTIRFGSVGAFPGEEGVVFIAPVVTGELLALHARCHALLAEAGLESWPYYLPDAWVPHCTAAVLLPPDKVGAAVGHCQASDVFGPGEVTGVSVVTFRPVKERARFSLGGAA